MIERLRYIIILFFVAAAGLLLIPMESAAQTYESYFLYIGDYPDEDNSDISPECQGITHDDTHWYVTQKWALWRIPVTQNLKDVGTSNAGVSRILLEDIPELSTFDHMGDPGYFKAPDSTGYVVVPMEGGITPVIAIFKAATLSYIGQFPLKAVTDAGCCAVNKKGIIYLPDGYRRNDIYFSRKLLAYELNWNELKQDRIQFNKRKDLDIEFLDFSGKPVEAGEIQGLDFSETDALLYIVCGDSEGSDPTFGIHVFDTKSGKRTARSSSGGGPFFYTWQPGGVWYEEPEGLCVWDLDDGRGPNISGQLHVLLLDNEGGKYWNALDQIYIKHYANKIYVNSNYLVDGRGIGGRTYETMAEACQKVLDGSRIMIYSGRHTGPFFLKRAVQVYTEGGNAVIGKAGQILMKPRAKIKISGAGFIKVY